MPIKRQPRSAVGHSRNPSSPLGYDGIAKSPFQLRVWLLGRRKRLLGTETGRRFRLTRRYYWRGVATQARFSFHGRTDISLDGPTNCRKDGHRSILQKRNLSIFEHIVRIGMVHSNRQLNLRHADARKRNFRQVRPLSHNIFMGYGSLAQIEKWDSIRVTNFKLVEAFNGLKTEENCQD